MTAAVTLAQQVASGVSLGFKNRIINGAMTIAQRGTSFSFGTGSGTKYFGSDRFFTQDYTWSAGSNITVSNDSTVYPTGFTNSYKWANGATPLTFSSGGTQSINQNIEGFNISDCYSKSVTVSFWVRSSTAGTYSTVFTNDGINYPRYIVKTYVINSANTWEYKTVTVDLSAGTSSGTWNTTNGNGLSVQFMLGTAADRTGNGALDTWTNISSGTIQFATSSSVNLATIANSTFYITGVQLEVGTTATNFEYRPYGTELALCQRYYQTITMMSGYTGPNATLIQCSIPFNQMRAAPTFSQSGPFRFDDAAAGYTQSSVGLGTNTVTNSGAQINFTNITVGGNFRPYGKNDAQTLNLSAEL